MKAFLSVFITSLLFGCQCNNETTRSDHPSTDLNGDPELSIESSTTRAESSIDSSDLVKVLRLLDKTLFKSRYMEQNCQDFTYPDWEGFPTKKCTYSVKDSNGTIKTAEVVMLNPSEEKLARWIITTCKMVKGQVKDQDVKKLVDKVIHQSGGQFPVAGIVYEDIGPNNIPDGEKKVYCFRNGVTVSVNDISNGSANQPNKAQIDSSLYGEVIKVHKYGRIISTTREQYLNNGGSEEVTGTYDNNWMNVVRDLYKKAWHSDTNELMVAWARDRL